MDMEEIRNDAPPVEPISDALKAIIGDSPFESLPAVDMMAMEAAGGASERPDYRDSVPLDLAGLAAANAGLAAANAGVFAELAALAAAETAAFLRDETRTVAEHQAYDDTMRLRDIPKGSAENPHGTLDQSKRFHWTGRDIMGSNYQGSSDDTAGCYADSTKAGAVLCHHRANPAWVDLVIAPEQIPISEYERGYKAGWVDADAAYQDLKALIQNFAAVQAAETSDDVDMKYPFVSYVRHNR